MKNILFDVQRQVVDLIKEDETLSSVVVLAENSKDIDFEIQNALGVQGIVAVVMTPRCNYIGNYEDKGIAYEIDELTIQVVENVSINRGQNVVLTGQDIAMRIMDWLSSPVYGRNGMFSPISYEQGEDNNLLVNKVVFKCVVYDKDDGEEEEEEEKLNEPLTFTSIGKSTVMLKKFSSPYTINLECSFDGKNWIAYNINSTVSLDNNEKFYLRAVNKNDVFSKDANSFYQFVVKGLFTTSGNLMTLLDKSGKNKVVPEWAFFRLFYDCDSILQTPYIKCDEVKEYGCNSMYAYCDKLIAAQKLPATKVGERCYSSMFKNTTQLIYPPELPAKELAANCYAGMFDGSSSLAEQPTLKITSLASGCVSKIFTDTKITSFTVDMSECTSVPKLPATNLFSSSEKPYTVLVPSSLYDEWIATSGWSSIKENVKAA